MKIVFKNRLIPDYNPDINRMKAMLKSELARAAGVSSTTFQRWLKPHQSQLEMLGNAPRAKLLNPAGVAYVCHAFCIEI